jgi:zinc transporter ZupT
MEYVHYVGLMAITLSLLLVFGPQIRTRLHNHTLQVSSFGGGVAIAYVFLVLFPEVEHSREILGASVHVITVLSLLVFFALEVLLSRLRAREHAPDHSHHNAERFWFHIAIIWVYTWLVMFTVPEDAADNLVYVLAASATISVHLLYKDYVLRGHYDGKFEQAGRFVLALAPIAGWLSHQIVQPSDGTLEIMIAILAGVLIQSVFQEELPPVERMSYRWLVAGVAIMAGLSLYA